MTGWEARAQDALAPGDTFDCVRLHCRLSAAACVARQQAYRSGNGYGDRVPAFQGCAGDTCTQGLQVRSRLPRGYSPPPFRELRSDLREQARARRGTERTRVEAVTIDTPPRPPAARGAAVRPGGEALPARQSSRCSACGKPLRVSSKGDLCYRCHVRAGHVVPGRPDLSSIPSVASGVESGVASGVAAVRTALPDPAELPTEYLVRCVNVAMRLRVRINAALDCQVGTAASFDLQSPGDLLAGRGEGDAS